MWLHCSISAHIVLWIQLEELPLLRDLISIFLQLVFAEGAFFKVPFDLRGHSVGEKTLRRDWRQRSSRGAIGHVWFEFEALQVWHHKLRDHCLDGEKLPAGEFKSGGPGTSALIMGPRATLAGELCHSVSSPHQTPHQRGQHAHLASWWCRLPGLSRKANGESLEKLTRCQVNLYWPSLNF